MNTVKRHRQWVDRIRLALAVVLGFGFMSSASAHYLWFERGEGELRIYFGEWMQDLRETQDGPLKAIQGLKVFTASGKPLEAVRRNDHFSVPAVAEDVYAFDEVMHRNAKVVYDIRFGRNSQKVVSGFELVPVTAGGNIFTLMLDRRPLPKAEVVVFGPPHWEKHYTSDDQGRIVLETPWQGLYVARAQYDDEVGGEFEGKRYDKIINVAILSFYAEQGQPWPGGD